MTWELLAAQAIQTALNTAAEGSAAQISAFAGMLSRSAAAVHGQQVLAPGQLSQAKPTELAAHASTHSHTTFPTKALMSQADHPYQGSLQVPAIAAHPQLTTRASGPAAAAGGGGQKAMTAPPVTEQQTPQVLQPLGDLTYGGTTDGSISESERDDPAPAAAAAQGYASDSEADHSSMDGDGPDLAGDAHTGPLGWQHIPPVGAPAGQDAGFPAGSFAAPASTPATAGTSIISALAAALRQQQGNMAPVHSLAPPASAAAAHAPAPAPGPQHVGMGMGQPGVDMAHQPPLSATADLLQLLVGLVRQASSRQQAPPATGAAAEGVGSLAVGTDMPAANSSAPGTLPGSIPMQQQQQQQREQQYMHWQQQLHAAAASSSAPARPTSSGALTAVSPAAMAVAAALTGIKPVVATSAAPAAAAVPHLAAAAVPAIMKRKASSSLPSSPGVLSPAAGGMYPAGISNSMAGQLLSSLAAQIPVQPHGCFNGNFFPAPAAAGRARPGGNAGTAAPSAWIGSGVGALRGRGFPTRATPEPDDEVDATDDEFDIRATAALAAAAATARGGAGVSMQDDACEGMDVDVSPSMAAAAAAMAGLAGLNCNSSGGGSAAVAGGVAAAGAVKPAQAQRSRKAQRLTGTMDGSQGQVGALQYQQVQYSQHGMTSVSQSSSAAAAAATAGADVQDPAAAAAAMLAGSLSWAQHWYGSWAPPAAADSGAAPAMAAGLPDATAAAAAAAEAGAYPWGQHTAGTLPVGMGWGSALGQQQQQQQLPAPRQQSKAAAGKAGAPKPRVRAAPKPRQDQLSGGFAAAAAAAGGESGSSGGGSAGSGSGDGGAVAVTAAGKRGPRGGGGRSSTSNFRGVTQHRYTMRWEAHLWDPDAPRCKTAGSSRTRGRQTYLGGFTTETEAARAYDRAALVYWGLTGFTNFPKEDYAAELPLLAVLQREEVVSNLRNNSHSMHKFQAKYLGVVPHQALPGLFEARLFESQTTGSYKYMGAYPTQEAAAGVLFKALQEQQKAYAEVMADAQLAAAAAAAAMPVPALPAGAPASAAAAALPATDAAAPAVVGEDQAGFGVPLAAL